MNRREMFTGLAAAMMAAQIPLPVAALEKLPDSKILVHLKRIREEIAFRLINPPGIMDENGTITTIDQTSLRTAYEHVHKLITELS